jgi:hypothetical protein
LIEIFNFDWCCQALSGIHLAASEASIDGICGLEVMGQVAVGMGTGIL